MFKACAHSPTARRALPRFAAFSKSIELFLLAATLISTCATAQPASTQNGDAEKQIASLSDQEYAAYFKGDTAAMRRIEADDIVIFADGKTETSQGRYESVEAKIKEGKWFSHGVKLSSEARNTRVLGDNAIAWGVVMETIGHDKSRVAYTEAWSRKSGSWKLVYLTFNSLP